MAPLSIREFIFENVVKSILFIIRILPSGNLTQLMFTRIMTAVSPTLTHSGRGLLIASLNINGHLTHIDELRVFMFFSNVDILQINESKLDSAVHSDEVYIPGFEIVRKDRKVNGRHGGGACTYLRTNLNYRIRNNLNNDLLECPFVKISNPRSIPFVVGTWYQPPSSPLNLYSKFEKFIAKIDAENTELYLLGDFNCKLLPEANAYSSSYLTNIFNIYSLIKLITEPTCITLVSKTLIDLCITNSREKVTNSDVIHLGISDHSLLTRKAQYYRNSPRVIERQQVKHFDKGNF